MPHTHGYQATRVQAGLWYWSRLSYAQAMLPIFRILPVGGVLLAIFILVLALSPPDGSRAPLNSAMAPARGALVDRNRHPEVRQFLMLAALKRADELNRLRELPDTPTRTEPAPTEPARTEAPPEEAKIATLPADQNEADPDVGTAATESPSVSIPVEIGEPSSTELPVTRQEKASLVETPEPTKTPEPAKTAREIRRRAHHQRHPRPTIAAKQHQFNLFEILFGGQQYQYQQPAYSSLQPGQQRPAYGSPQIPPQQPPMPYVAPPAYTPQQPAQPQQKPAQNQPTFGEQPGPQAQKPTRPVPRPSTRRSNAQTGTQSAQSTAGDPNPMPTH